MRTNTIVLTSVALAAGLAALSSTAANAQRANAKPASARVDTDRRWLPFLGCWQGDNGGPTVVCIAPVTGSRNVDRLTIDNGAIVGGERLVADSVSRRFTRDGCRGIETGEWSASGRQLYLRAEFTCADSLDGKSTTLLAFSPAGAWIESMQLRAARGTLERATQYHDAGFPSSVPKEIATALRGRQLAIATARAAAAAPITTDEVNEATRSVGETVARPWLVARTDVADSAAQRAVASSDVTAPSPSGQEYECPSGMCATRHPYSVYNGTLVPPYPSYGVYSSYGYLPSYWAPAPLVVIGGTSRRSARSTQALVRRPIGIRGRDYAPAPRATAGRQAPSHAAAPRRR